MNQSFWTGRQGGLAGQEVQSPLRKLLRPDEALTKDSASVSSLGAAITSGFPRPIQAHLNVVNVL